MSLCSTNRGVKMKSLFTWCLFLFVGSAIFSGDPEFFKARIGGAWNGISSLTSEVIKTFSGPRIEKMTEVQWPTISSKQGGWMSEYRVSSGTAVKQNGFYAADLLVGSDTDVVLTMVFLGSEKPAFAGFTRNGEHLQGAIWLPSGNGYKRRQVQSVQSISGIDSDQEGNFRVTGQSQNGGYYEGILIGV